MSAGAGPKAALRRHYRRWRRLQDSPAADGGSLDGVACGSPIRAATAEASILAAALRQLPPLLAGDQWLGLYWPLAGEPDLRPLAVAGCSLALPAVEPALAGQPARMVYRPWSPGDPLAADACGIPAPLAERGPLPPAALGLLLAPALAFDPVSGIRLGQGGGWYDRLRADPAWASVPALAVLPAACLHRGLPRDPWDIPFPGWLDEGGMQRLVAL